MERIFALEIGSVFSPANTFPTFGSVVQVVVKNAFVLAGVISFVLLVFGGFGVIMAAGSGDTKSLEKGKQAITGAITGLIVVVCSLWIVQLIEKVTGISLLTPR